MASPHSPRMSSPSQEEVPQSTGNVPLGDEPVRETPAVRSNAASEIAKPKAREILSRLELGRRNSKLSFVSTRLFHSLSWTDPILTALTLAVLLVVLLAMSLQLTLGFLVGNALVAVLLVSGVLELHNRLMPQTPLPNLQLHVDKATVSQLASTAAVAFNDAVARLNASVLWSDPVASCRVMAYAWLLARLGNLTALPTLAIVALLGFVLAPAYLLVQPQVDAVWERGLQPRLRHVAKRMTNLETSLTSQMAPTRTVATLGTVAVGTVAAYTAWTLLSLPGTLTTAALALTARDILVRVLGATHAHRDHRD